MINGGLGMLLIGASMIEERLQVRRGGKFKMNLFKKDNFKWKKIS